MVRPSKTVQDVQLQTISEVSYLIWEVSSKIPNQI